jgi:Holliday junction resolvase-like predicted endonuclease
MKINKSTRHSKIAGDFGEMLVLYWLSKYGFECAKVDHTGIDIIARNPHSKEVMGISVKSRTRNAGKEKDVVNLLADDFKKLMLPA